MQTKVPPPAAPHTQSHHHRPFYHRFLLALAFSCGLIGFSLIVGTVGYHTSAELPWIDALLNASMILTGMGPVNILTTDGAKLFASVYALFSGVVFITATGILLTPIFHRVLHRFHFEERDFF